MIESMIRNHTKSQLRELQGFIKVEREAQARRDRQAIIRVSGEFHLRIAEIAGNSVLARILKQLVSRTSLIIAMYEVPGQSGCNSNHHEHLVSLAAKGEAQKAAEFMREHLDSIERSLRLDSRPSETIDLQSVFERIAGRR
jgi:DNA-binding GntR family transcriptional regulator